MAREKICGIYCIENIINNKKYIGSSIDIHKRWQNHKQDFKHNKHDNELLMNAWYKYGEINFKFYVLEEITDVNMLGNIEKYYIDLFHTCNRNFGYNLSLDTYRVTFTKEHLIRKIANGERQISLQDIELIKYYLCETNLNLGEISRLTNVKAGILSNIYQRYQYKSIFEDCTFKFRNNIGENNPKSKLCEKQALEIIELLKENISFYIIAEQYNVKPKTIYNIYYHESWAYLTNDIVFEKRNKLMTGHNKKAVYKYDLSGLLIDNYDSIVVASEMNNITKYTLRIKCMNNERYENYLWSYKPDHIFDLNVIEKTYNFGRCKRVNQCDTDGNIIQSFSTIKEAAKYMNCSRDTIRHYCKDKEKRMYKGYIWEYA